MNCRYCAHRNGGHDSKCPELAEAGSIERKLYMASWQGGYDDGRAGKLLRFAYPSTPEQKQAQTPTEAAYHLGYGRGEVALEEAENGCTSWAG
jgi:hypothetical protein